MTPEQLALLLTVARVLRSRLPEMAIAYQADDLAALNEALKPFDPTGEELPPTAAPKPVPVYMGPTCRGSYVLRTACGRCEKCADERAKLGRTEAH